jgi:thiosulfate dehydrogenase (quinone) large subunit
MLQYSYMFSNSTTSLLALIRIAMGWILGYAGYTHIIDQTWSAAPVLAQATTFPTLFAWFAQPDILPWVNIANSWGLLVLGGLLIIGLFTRYMAILAGLVMILYYLALLHFPHIGQYSLVIDEHIVYILVLFLLAIVRAGDYWGLDSKISL